VDPRLGGEMSRIMMAAGARHISLRANPTSRAAKDWPASGASTLATSTGHAAMVAPAHVVEAHIFKERLPEQSIGLC